MLYNSSQCWDHINRRVITRTHTSVYSYLGCLKVSGDYSYILLLLTSQAWPSKLSWVNNVVCHGKNGHKLKMLQGNRVRRDDNVHNCYGIIYM